MSDTIRELKEKLSKLERVTDSIRETTVYLEGEQQTSAQIALPLKRGRGRPRKRTPLIEQIVEILQEHGGVMHRREILHALAREKNISIKGETPTKQLQRLSAHLSHHKDLLEPACIPGDGRWKLKQPQ